MLRVLNGTVHFEFDRCLDLLAGASLREFPTGHGLSHNLAQQGMTAVYGEILRTSIRVDPDLEADRALDVSQLGEGRICWLDEEFGLSRRTA